MMLIEGFRPPEHSIHIAYITNIPATYRLIKYSGIAKHSGHIRHRTYIPVAYRVVEGNWHCIKHTDSYSVTGAYIPVTYRLVKYNGIIKHFTHICYHTYIPHAYRLVKRNRILKHTVHICHSTGHPNHLWVG